MSSVKVCGIYGLHNTSTNKWYVGQSLDIFSRWRRYKSGKKLRQPKLEAALLEFGADGFDYVILERCSTDNRILNVREIIWSDFYNSVEDGYNERRCGNGKLSKCTRTRISNALRGKKRLPFTETAKLHMSEVKSGPKNYWFGRELSLEHRRRISESKLGKKRSAEQIERLRTTATGRKHSAATKIKMSLSQRRRFGTL